MGTPAGTEPVRRPAGRVALGVVRHGPEPGWFVLEDAARALSTPPHALWGRLKDARRPVRRIQLEGRWVSLVRGDDCGLDPQGRPQAQELEPDVGSKIFARIRELQARKESLETAVIEARRELVLQHEREQLALEQWRALEVELDQARRQRERIEDVLAESERRVREVERELVGARERSQRLEHALTDERELGRRQELELADEREQRARLERELAALREVERARERYCDKLERRLRARRGADHQ